MNEKTNLSSIFNKTTYDNTTIDNLINKYKNLKEKIHLELLIDLSKIEHVKTASSPV